MPPRSAGMPGLTDRTWAFFRLRVDQHADTAGFRSSIVGASGIVRAAMLTTPSPKTSFSRAGGDEPTAQDRRIAVGPNDRLEVRRVDLQQRQVVLAADLDDRGGELPALDPAGKLASQLARFREDVSVRANHRAQHGRLAVAKHDRGAPAGFQGDGGDLAQQLRAGLAVLIARAADSQPGSERIACLASAESRKR